MLKLVRASAEHVRFISTLARDEVEAGLQWTWRPLRVARNLASKDGLGVVAVLDDLPAGFCIGYYGAESLHILLLAVDPDARRMGIGQKLIAWHEKCARVAGLERIELELRVSNAPGRAFYEALGFDVLVRRRNYYQGREDALLMRRELRGYG
jgi:ribosomal-protein-alanine N-acetyltransferase